MFFPEIIYLNIIIAIHYGDTNIYDKFKFLINIDKKSINTDDIVQGAKKTTILLIGH
jgi:hypothetical protein